MVNVKAESEIKKNFEDATALVPARFEAGVKTAQWKGPSLEGQTLYEEQMRRDEILKRRQSGIDKVSDDAWRRDTIEKGKAVIGARMKASSDKQVTGYRPYREALVSITLPAKTTDPMQNLINRAGMVVDTMVKTKAAQSR